MTSNGEGLPDSSWVDMSYLGVPFDLRRQADGYHFTSDHGEDHNVGPDPFGDESPEQTTDISELLADGEVVDDEKK